MASQWLGALPPPPGVEPNFINPSDQYAGNIALHATCLTLVTLLVAMRLYTRIRITKANLGVEDCQCTHFTITMMACAYQGLLDRSLHSSLRS